MLLSLSCVITVLFWLTQKQTRLYIRNNFYIYIIPYTKCLNREIIFSLVSLFVEFGIDYTKVDFKFVKKFFSEKCPECYLCCHFAIIVVRPQFNKNAFKRVRAKATVLQRAKCF